MTALAEREAPATNTLRPLLLAFLGVVVTVALIVCHGCHTGDHDDELSIPVYEEPRTK
jgi:hypothetical protein